MNTANILKRCCARAQIPAGYGRRAVGRRGSADLEGLREQYEKHHQVKITDDAVSAAVRLSARYINDRFLPDKAIDLMDELQQRYVCARVENRRKSLN